MEPRLAAPLPLSPLFVERVWGGSALAAHFGKQLPSGMPIGESWEAADLGESVSPVARGVHAGKTLRELAVAHGAALYGEAALPDGRMPLLFKLIDASSDLSVQVHPRDADVDPSSGDRGKEEAWYVLAAEKGARLVHGLRAGLSSEAFYRAVARNAAEECLGWRDARPGDVYYIPAGTIHAIGAGLLLAEIQQSSDTTYRIYDWGRVGLDGVPRKLHIEQAARIPPAPPVPAPYPLARRSPRAGEPDVLLEGESFRLLRYALTGGGRTEGELSRTFSILFTLDGAAELCNASGVHALACGETWLLPAWTGRWMLTAAERWEGLWMEPALRHGA